MRLSVKQRRFALKYLQHGNATQAAKESGYSDKTAYSQGQRLLKHVEIAKLLKKTFNEEEVTRHEVVRELKRIGLNDPRGFFNVKGNAIPLPKLGAAQAAAIAGFEVCRQNVSAGDGHTDWVIKYKLCNKNQALESLCKVLKLWAPDADTERVEVPVFIMPEGTRIAIK